MTPVIRLTAAVALVMLLTSPMTAGPQVTGSQAPPSPPPTGFILGRTVDGVSGRPIGGAQVSLNSSVPPTPVAPGAAPATLGRFPMRVLSDSNGAFVFRDLPKGGYSITATRSGYAPTAAGRSSAADTGSQSIELGDGERRGGISLKFWKYGAISGTVADEVGEPIIGIQVRVFRRAIVGGRLRFTSFGNMPTTDDRGAYRVANLTPGDYVVGVVSTQATVPVSLQEAMSEASAARDDLRRELDRSAGGLGGISGFVGGRRVGPWLLQTNPEFGTSRVLNPPGDGGKVFVYPTVFHPTASTVSGGTIITVASGDERTGTDFHLKPVPTSQVSGHLVGADGEQDYTSLSLMPAGSEDAQRTYDLATATAMTDATGAFTFIGVPAGEYTIRVLKIPPRPIATPSSMTTVIQTGTTTIMSSSGPTPPPPIPNDPTWWASVPVSVGDRDVTGVTVTLSKGARVTGRVEFVGSADRPTEDRLRLATVQFEQADAGAGSFAQFTLSRGVVDAAGQFKTYQMTPGRYVIRASGVPGWTFRSAVVNGRDVADSPFELGSEDIANVVVTFVDKTSELTGTVRSTKVADSGGTVYVFPADSAMWRDHGPAPRRFRTARVGTDGSYRLAPLPAGEYLAIAIASGVWSEWMDPKSLQKFAALATRLTIGDGEKRAQDLELREVR